MIKLIKAITPIDDANGMHSTFKTRSNQITYLFQVEFVDGDNGRCGSINTTPPYEAGDRVEANVVKETKDFIYWSIKKINEAFQPNIKPAIQDNSRVAVASVDIAINLFSASGTLNLKAEGREEISKLSMIIADLMIKTQNYLDQ